MGRGLLHAGVWAAATVVAVAVSWFGVHSVLRSTAYGPPRALPISVPSSGRPPGISSATHSPKPVPKSPVRATPSTRSATPAAHTSAPAASTPPPGGGQGHTSAPPDDVHSYVVNGGQVVLELAADSASLVSATPNAGWKMQLWTDQPDWLRVTFTSQDGTAASSVICTWNGHPPSVQAYED